MEQEMRELGIDPYKSRGFAPGLMSGLEIQAELMGLGHTWQPQPVERHTDNDEQDPHTRKSPLETPAHLAGPPSPSQSIKETPTPFECADDLPARHTIRRRLSTDFGRPIGASPVPEATELVNGTAVEYLQADGSTVDAVVIHCGRDDCVPYYTIQLAAGGERQTIREKLMTQDARGEAASSSICGGSTAEVSGVVNVAAAAGGSGGGSLGQQGSHLHAAQDAGRVGTYTERFRSWLQSHGVDQTDRFESADKLMDGRYAKQEAALKKAQTKLAERRSEILELLRYNFTAEQWEEVGIKLAHRVRATAEEYLLKLPPRQGPLLAQVERDAGYTHTEFIAGLEREGAGLLAGGLSKATRMPSSSCRAALAAPHRSGTLLRCIGR